MRPVIARYVLLAATLAGGCGDPPARVTLAPIDHACGKPVRAAGLRVTAYAARGEVTRAVGIDEHVDIADFPADTEQLGIEVLIGGGVVGAAGKTAPLAFGDLADGATIPVFMAPPHEMCPTVAPMTEPRVAPLVARAGDGVLVVGGHDGAGRWLSTAEYYDPATATFAAVEVPEVLGENGFAGAAVATLPDGRVVVSGGPLPVITVFDPVARAFGESVLIESRAFHAAIATGDDQVLVAAGCSDVASGACSGGVMRKSTKLYDTAALGMDAEVGPNLRIGRVAATLVDVGIGADGARSYVLAGGVAPDGVDPSGADRLSLAEPDAVAVTGTFARAAALDGGAVLTAFAQDAEPPAGTASVIAPTAEAARPIARAPDRAGARLVTLEDGRVLAVGGDPAGDVLLYDPTSDRWTVEPLAPRDPSWAPGPLIAPSPIRLADGSVLVLGGAVPSASAWIYRPSLLGPTAGSVTVVPGAPVGTVLTAPDPGTVSRAPDWQLTSSGGLARALVGGPRMATGAVSATVRVRAGGVALLARDQGPGRAVVAELAPGSPARVVELAAGRARTLCSGMPVPALEPDAAVGVRLALDDGIARVSVDGRELAACTVEGSERGAWGVAAHGAGARVTVETVTVAR